ncbi:hypothetical protein QVD17_24504 [Tagetes erecta]|uniref:Reverse transcriptase domain-containing protein n=1 Tax=Tagetes erecta TaxID=13708 RepID=A0AAD8KFR3_TARER|nr:hypothetical protein QVD17_24504 [Tagetes erecta]
MIEGCTITLLGRSFPTDLCIITLGSFEVILGMDWLSKFDANIVCRERWVRLKALDGSPITVYGDQESKIPRVISMMKANRLIQQGCNSFLAYVKDVEGEPKQLLDVPIVCKFPEPVAKAPYRLAPSEMKELMTQLKDLLDKGFI